MYSHRLLIVSNRLPVTARLAEGRVCLTETGGGLATGLRRYHAESDGLWIGWPGDTSAFTRTQDADLDAQLRDRAIVPVRLSCDAIERYYHGFSNRVLWPLFHYLTDRMPVEASGWSEYRDVNIAFAEAVAREYRPGDTIWVHDYHLMLLPALLRERLPDARIGFFLHIPFPSSEVFRILPQRREVLTGLLGADLLGFHTFSYLRHFVSSLLHVDGVEADIDRVRVGRRSVRLGVFPMGIDAAQFAATASDPDVVRRAETIRRDAGDRKIVVGVDRLDYTKGIPRRLHAIERLLEREPALADRMRYIQVAVPSRGEVDSYQTFKRQLEEIVGRINGACGTLQSAPVHYVHTSVSAKDLVALYRAADVMLVTPLRDGMNLVAKEFAASRVDDDGVLVLSEFAGAAAQLHSALVVNPYDVDAVADTLQRALSMPAEERRARMRGLRRIVAEQDVHAWAASFLRQLESLRQPAAAAPRRPGRSLAGTLEELRRTMELRLLLDYDGTLVPLARSPELAAPDGELRRLLSTLARTKGIRIDIVSGRPRGTLEAWLGELPIGLWAEHGFWHRPYPAHPWQAAMPVTPDWIDRVRPILEQFAAATPGAHIEVKSASIAWHYRGASREFGARQAHELRLLLGDALSNQPLEVLEGKKVIEVRWRGIGKGVVAQHALAEAGTRAVVVAIGDDRTDEELFRALPPSSVTVAVGREATDAAFQLADCRAVRRLLQGLLSDDAGTVAQDGERTERASA